jgi:hypothetical protein
LLDSLLTPDLRCQKEVHLESKQEMTTLCLLEIYLSNPPKRALKPTFLNVEQSRMSGLLWDKMEDPEDSLMLNSRPVKQHKWLLRKQTLKWMEEPSV